MNRPPQRRAPFALAFVFVLSCIAGCARSSELTTEAKNCACAEADAKLVDQALVAWLSKARTLHHLADVAETEGAVDQAITPLEQLVDGSLPPGPPQEVSEVLADTYARMAELRTRSGDFERADRDVAAGLDRAPAATYFRGHLLEVRGLIYEKLSEKLERAGKHSEAKQVREKAIGASLEAVRIQDEVIKGALGDAGSANKRDR